MTTWYHRPAAQERCVKDGCLRHAVFLAGEGALMLRSDGFRTLRMGA